MMMTQVLGSLTHVGVLGSWLCLSPALALWGIWESNQQTELSLSLALSLCSFKFKKKLDTILHKVEPFRYHKVQWHFFPHHISNLSKLTVS